MKTIRWLSLAAIALLASCADGVREETPPTRFTDATPIGFPSTVRYFSADPRDFLSRSRDLRRQLAVASPDGTINVLALSGGAAGGAFGAGALVGLSRRGERPRFDVVTGVSAGALIAPFAFLGPTWDDRLIAAFAAERTEGLMGSHSFDSLFRPGWFHSAGLAEVVDHYVTSELLDTIAHEASRGRMLLVATTDLDDGETVIWNMGVIAAQGGESSRRLFRDVLVASASIPGLFPPVMIPVEQNGVRYEEMHVDGGLTTPFLDVPEAAFMSPLDGSLLRGVHIYVIVNGQTGRLPLTTPLRNSSILTKSFSAVLDHTSRTHIALISAFARLYGMAFHFTEIPVDHSEVAYLDFSPSNTQALFDYGLRCAEHGRLWMTLEQAVDHGEVATVASRSPRPRGEDLSECPLRAPPTSAFSQAPPH